MAYRREMQVEKVMVLVRQLLKAMIGVWVEGVRKGGCYMRKLYKPLCGEWGPGLGWTRGHQINYNL